MRSGQWILLASLVVLNAPALAQNTYRGISVAPERRCAPYDRGDYAYPQSVEASIIKGIGKVYGPYSGKCFASGRETDIEHIVALSEAHDSGLCAASAATQKQFARDPLNLTLASPSVNRNEKGLEGRSGMAPASKCMLVCGTDVADAA